MSGYYGYRSCPMVLGLVLTAAVLTCASQAGAALSSAPSPSALPAAQAAPAGSQDSNSFYVLGSGDELSLHIEDMEELSDKPMRINPDGDLDLPLAGQMHAAGLTIEQFKAALAAKLSKYITSPQIAVNLIDNQSRTVSVIGEVASPGIHPLERPRTLIDVISLAGGVKADAGSKVILTRGARWGPLPLPGATTDPSRGFTTVSLSLDDLLAAKTPTDNILILPGDIVSIPKGGFVYVVGEVHRSGGFPLASQKTISILQALSLAEGLSPTAATKNAKILRPVNGKDVEPLEIPVNVKLIFAGKAPDVPLYANDILFIPNSAAKSGSRRALEAVLQAATGVAIYSH